MQQHSVTKKKEPETKREIVKRKEIKERDRHEREHRLRSEVTRPESCKYFSRIVCVLVTGTFLFPVAARRLKFQMFQICARLYGANAEVLSTGNVAAHSVVPDRCICFNVLRSRLCQRNLRRMHLNTSGNDSNHICFNRVRKLLVRQPVSR